MTSPLPDPRPRVVLLHGALGAADQLALLAEAMAPVAAVSVHEFAGHGQSAAGADFDLSTFADELGAWLAPGGPAYLFGYSMGGYAALLLATRRPELVRGVLTLGTKFWWNPEAAAQAARFMDPAAVEAKVPAFAAALAARHAALGWQEVLRRTAGLLHQLGDRPLLTPEVLATLQRPVRLLVGDRDNTVTVDETAQVAQLLPAADSRVLPGAPHPLEQVPLDALVGEVRAFFDLKS